MLLSPNSLCLPHDRPLNPRDEVLRQGRDFNPGAGRLQEEDRLAPQNNHLIGVWMPCAFIDQRGTKVKRQDREGDAVGK